MAIERRFPRGTVDAVELGDDPFAVEDDEPPRLLIGSFEPEMIAVVVAAEKADLNPAPRQRVAPEKWAVAALDRRAEPVPELLRDSRCFERVARGEREQRRQGKADARNSAQGAPQRFAFGSPPGIGPTIVAGSR